MKLNSAHAGRTLVGGQSQDASCQVLVFLFINFLLKEEVNLLEGQNLSFKF